MIEKKPIFIQVKDYYEHLIDVGALKDGDEMPSVREVALQYGANPNTIQRAFSLMVEDGYLLSIPKKGFYVQKGRMNRDKYLKERIQELLENGYTKEEIKKELEDIKK